MKFQVAKVYRYGRFMGYGIAVDGNLLDGQVSTIVETNPNEIPKLISTFNLSSEHLEDAPRIDLDNPQDSTEIHVVIHPNKPLTVEQIEELRDAVKGIIAKHNLSDGGVWTY